MAAPSLRTETLLLTDAGGAWTFTDTVGGVSGELVILTIIQDGTTSSTVTLDSATNIENLAGTDNAWTSIGTFNIGSPTSALHHLWIGRTINTSAPTATGSNGTSEDLYAMFFHFSDVSTGTTLATVIENGTAGSTANGVGTSTTVSDTAVTTIGPDRLAVNFIGVDDDISFSTLGSGETGGDWANISFDNESSGTDGAEGWTTATMASPGTIDGMTATISPSAGWGVVGFALIGTTPAAPPGLKMPPSAQFVEMRPNV